MAESSTNEIIDKASKMTGEAFEWMKSIYKQDSRLLTVDAASSNGDWGFSIPSPAWYPDSLVRSVRKSLFQKMVNASYFANPSEKPARGGATLDFYSESSAGMIGSLWNSAVTTVMSTATGQITSITGKVDSAVNAVKSLFADDEKMGISSLLYGNRGIPFLHEQPYVVVKGIHPEECGYEVFKCIQLIMPKIMQACSEIGEWITGDKKKTTDIGGKIEKVLKEFNKNAKSFVLDYFDPGKKTGLKNTSDWTEIAGIMKDDSIRMHSLAETMLLEIINGHYAFNCKLPYIGNSGRPLIQTSGESGWNGGGNMISGAFEAIGDAVGINAAWNNPLRWSRSDIKNFTPLHLHFTAFNDTFEHFLSNYLFMTLFMATGKAVTDIIFVRAPYLYDIEIPGGFRYQLCTLSGSISPIGKTRCLVSDSSQFSQLEAALKTFIGGGERDVNMNAIRYVPDAYDMDFTFTSMLPDLWNFMDSYVFPTKGRENTPGIGDNQAYGSQWHNIPDTLSGRLTNFVDILVKNL